MDWKRQLSYCGLLLFPVSLALPIALNYKSMALIVFFVTLATNVPHLTKIDKATYKNSLVYLFVGFFLMEIGIGLIRDHNIDFNDVRLSFLIAPIMFFVSKDMLQRHRSHILNAFVIGVCIYIVYSIFYVVYFYGFYNPSKPFIPDYYLKYVLYNYMPGAMHHTYIGMYISFAMAIVLFEWKSDMGRKLSLTAPMFLTLFFLGSKWSILIASILLLYWFGVILITYNRRKLAIGSMLLFTCLVGYGIFYSDLFRTLGNSFFTRISFFKCAVRGIEQNWLLGVGRDNIKFLISDCLPDSSRMDAHNILLQEFLSNGVFGFIVLLLLLGTLFARATNNLTLSIFLIIFLLFGMVEHMFSTQLGVTYFVFFSLLLQFQSRNKSDGDTTSNLNNN